ncbi:ParB family protein [Sedimenticola selenatireducens]|uniref:ParB family protein n=1 Tax=Sedimenticola selenatireducens TaxID=191960 RepID=UPI0004B0AC75|nr:ParB family protein [Sedimenticola selenatireducens]
MDEHLRREPVVETEVNQPAPMVLPIDRIHPYERNPRQGNNPEYDRIKASIRATGLDQPLTITQRPGADDYIVHSGGNTRLRVLKSLYEETGEARYATVACLFKPWHCESEVLLAHLRENDLRGGLTFIDKARAILEIKRLLETECQIEELSQRRLESALQQGGYALSSGLVSRMGYAVQTLLPLIPQALHAGLGRPQVQKIRALERAARQVWQSHELGADTTFDPVFAALCQRYDDPDWDTELLRNALESEIAEQADVSVHLIRMELDARIEGRAVMIPPPEEDPDLDEDDVDWLDKPPANTKFDSPVSLAPEPGKRQDQPLADCSPDSDISEDPDVDPVAEALPDNEVGIAPASNDFEFPDTTILDEAPAGVGVAGSADLKSLRARAWTLASRMAQRNGLSDLVLPLSRQGLGFTLRDVPDPALADQLDEATLSQLSLIWWQLAACAELTVAPAASILPHLPTESVLRQALEQQDPARLFDSVWTLDPGQTGHRLWRRLGDRDWMDLLNLMDCYRRMHHLAEERQLDLWAAP